MQLLLLCQQKVVNDLTCHPVSLNYKVPTNQTIQTIYQSNYQLMEWYIVVNWKHACRYCPVTLNTFLSFGPFFQARRARPCQSARRRPAGEREAAARRPHPHACHEQGRYHRINHLISSPSRYRVTGGRIPWLGWLRFGMFHHPAWAVGSYSSRVRPKQDSQC